MTASPSATRPAPARSFRVFPGFRAEFRTETSLPFRILGAFPGFLMPRGDTSLGGLGCTLMNRHSQNSAETKSPFQMTGPPFPFPFCQHHPNNLHLRVGRRDQRERPENEPGAATLEPGGIRPHGSSLVMSNELGLSERESRTRAFLISWCPGTSQSHAVSSQHPAWGDMVERDDINAARAGRTASPGSASPTAQVWGTAGRFLPVKK